MNSNQSSKKRQRMMMPAYDDHTISFKDLEEQIAASEAPTQKQSKPKKIV